MNSPRRQYTPAVLLVIGTSQRHHQRVRGSQNVYGVGNAAMIRKNWKILSVDYRRPIQTFAVTISAVIGLQFYRTA